MRTDYICVQNICDVTVCDLICILDFESMKYLSKSYLCKRNQKCMHTIASKVKKQFNLEWHIFKETSCDVRGPKENWSNSMQYQIVKSLLDKDTRTRITCS